MQHASDFPRKLSVWHLDDRPEPREAFVRAMAEYFLDEDVRDQVADRVVQRRHFVSKEDYGEVEKLFHEHGLIDVRLFRYADAVLKELEVKRTAPPDVLLADVHGDDLALGGLWAALLAPKQTKVRAYSAGPLEDILAGRDLRFGKDGKYLADAVQRLFGCKVDQFYVSEADTEDREFYARSVAELLWERAKDIVGDEGKADLGCLGILLGDLDKAIQSGDCGRLARFLECDCDATMGAGSSEKAVGLFDVPLGIHTVANGLLRFTGHDAGGSPWRFRYLFPELTVELSMAAAMGPSLLARMQQACQQLRELAQPFHGIVGVSQRHRDLVAVIEHAAGQDGHAFVFGRSGVGKELVCHAIHRASRRRDAPCHVFNCGAFRAEMAQSELFGVAPDSGLTNMPPQGKKGAFQMADGGVLILDEIDKLPKACWPLLLRVLETGEIQRVGASTTNERVDVRVISASNRNLKRMADRGRFPTELISRICGLDMIIVPTLAERKDDIPFLAFHFLCSRAEKTGIDLKPYSRWGLFRTVQCLRSRDFSLNHVRELRNFIDREVANAIDRRGRFDLSVFESRLRAPPPNAEVRGLPRPAGALARAAFQQIEAGAIKRSYQDIVDCFGWVTVVGVLKLLYDRHHSDPRFGELVREKLGKSWEQVRWDLTHRFLDVEGLRRAGSCEDFQQLLLKRFSEGQPLTKGRGQRKETSGSSADHGPESAAAT